MALQMSAPRPQGKDLDQKLAKALAGALRTMRDKLAPKKNGSAEDVNRYSYLERLVIEACTEARRYRLTYGTSDPPARRRQRDTEVLGGLESHRKAVRRVANFIRRYPEYIGQALKQMHRVEGVSISFREKTSLADAWYRLLNAYEEALAPERVPAKRGPFVHRSRIGPLDFGASVDRQRGARIDAVQTGLLFQLVLYFRRYTSGKEGAALGYMQTGEPMPAQGDPCWLVCGELLAATLDTEILAPDDLGRRLNKLLQKHPKLSFVGWPGPPASSRPSEPEPKT
jgi:hypothetical protein